jgi:hypothetical protein
VPPPQPSSASVNANGSVRIKHNPSAMCFGIL